MKKRLNQLLHIVLGTLTVLFFIALTLLIVNLSNQLKARPFDNYIMYIGAILSCVFIFLFKKKKDLLYYRNYYFHAFYNAEFFN